MASKEFMEKQQKLLLRKFHAMCGTAGISEDQKRVMIAGYGVNSSRELTARDLMDICEKIDRMNRPDLVELDVWRKRLIASIFGWRKAMRYPTNINEVKAIACRAGEVDRFNDISIEKLRSLYNAFSKKTKDMQTVNDITHEELNYIISVN